MRQKVYRFLDHLLWSGKGKFSLLLREYLQLAVNVLPSSPKISQVIENNFFSINLSQNEENVE